MSQLGGGDTTLTGAKNFGLLGWDVSNIGDFNGDGFEDFAVMAPHGSRVSSGNANAWEAYVLYGSAKGVSLDINLQNLQANQGLRIFSSQSFGAQGTLDYSSGYGDINGDGYDDLIISGYQGNAAFVIMGRDTSAASGSKQIDVANFKTGGANQEGFGIFSNGTGMALGVSSTIADVNNDGYADILIANNNGPAGIQVIYGHEGAAGTAAWANYGLNNSQVTDNNGVSSTRPYTTIQTDGGGNNPNESVTGLHDVNGDGFQDFAWAHFYAKSITVMYGGINLTSDGKIGVDSNGSNILSVTNTPQAGRGFRLTNVDLVDPAALTLDSNSTLTHAIASGDFNGDGIADVVVGAEWFGGNRYSAGQGQAYVVFGTEGGLSGDIDVRTLAANGQGFAISSPTYSTSTPRYDSFGHSVTMGDFNGDGIDDIAIGAPLADYGGGNTGSVYIIYGKSGAPASFGDIVAGVSGPAGQTGSMERMDGDQGMKSGDDNRGQGESTFGSTLGSGLAFVDLNGDGIADLVTGSPHENTSGTTKDRTGSVDITYGSPLNMTQSYTAGNDTLVGTSGVDRLSGGAGDDVITQISTGDVAYGGQGDDLIAITSTDFVRVDGNDGINTLRVDSSSGLNLNFASLGMKVQNFNVIDLGTTSSDVNGDHTVQLRLSDVMSLTQGQAHDGTFQPLRINGDVGDKVLLQASDSYAASSVQTVDGVTYDVWHHTPAVSDVWAGTQFADVWVQQGVIVQNFV